MPNNWEEIQVKQSSTKRNDSAVAFLYALETFNNLKIGENKMEKKFTKEDLKPCMMIKLRSGRFGIINQLSKDLSITECGNDYLWNRIKDYNDDLTCSEYSDRSWDIMQVFGFAKHGGNISLNSLCDRELLWERIEKTPQQIKLEEMKKTVKELNRQILELEKEV